MNVQEALELSRIRPELKLRNVPLYAVVHETLGVEEFAPFLEADGIYLDTEVGCDAFEFCCCTVSMIYIYIRERKREWRSLEIKAAGAVEKHSFFTPT